MSTRDKDEGDGCTSVDSMRIFFLGSTKFSLHCLKVALDCGMRIVGCAWTPEVFKISYAPDGQQNMNYVDFKLVAADLHVPCIHYERGNLRGFIEQVAPLRPELLLVAGWYYMVPKKLRDVARLGAVGLHGSLLPKYRGGAPLVWAMINGEKEAGLTLFHLNDHVDAGDIIGQEPFQIGDTDTIANLLGKVDVAAEKLLRTYLPTIANGSAPCIPQNETEATYVPQRKPEDGLIDWSKSPTEIWNFIRAQTKPYPGAFTFMAGKKVTIYDAKIEMAEPILAVTTPGSEVKERRVLSEVE